MTPEKDEELCRKYPKIFRDRYASPQSTCMCWGFDCGDGWYDLIDTLCSHIQNHVDNQIRQQEYKFKRGEIDPEDYQSEDCFQVVAAQVKEKFGGLRFYVDGADDEVRGMIEMAEGMSYKICEDCGNRGSIRKTDWHRTMCDPCNETWQARRTESWKKETG